MPFSKNIFDVSFAVFVRRVSYSKDRHQNVAASSAATAASAISDSLNAETSLKCASYAETWAANESSRQQKRTGSYAAGRAAEHENALSRYVEVRDFAQNVKERVGGKDELVPVAKAADEEVTAAALRLHKTSARLMATSHEADLTWSTNRRAEERSTLASFERARAENVVTALTAVVQEKRGDARSTMKAATLVRNAYAAALQEVLRTQSLQIAAENRLAAVRADSRNAVNEARRHYENMKRKFDAAVEQQTAAKHEALKLSSQKARHDMWVTADMWDKELEQESILEATRESASRHWQGTRQKYQLARQAQEAATVALENGVQEMCIAALERDRLRVDTVASISTAVEVLLSAEEAEAVAARELEDAMTAETMGWRASGSADEEVAYAGLMSNQARHAREVARVRAENDVDARNAAIMTLSLQKERREACASDLARSNAALLEAESLSAEIDAAVSRNAASVSMSIAALGSVAHARENVKSMASELKEAADAVENAEEILKKWELSCLESSLAVSKLAAEELEAIKAEASAVTKSLMLKKDALSLSKQCADAKQRLDNEQQSLVLARQNHEAATSLATREDDVAARRLRMAEAEFVALHLASKQAGLDVESASQAEADARRHVKAVSEQHPRVKKPADEKKLETYPANVKERGHLKSVIKESFGDLLTPTQKASLLSIITSVCMRRGRAMLVRWRDFSEARRNNRQIIAFALGRMKAGVVLRVFHSWRSHTAKQQHNRMALDVFFHTPLLTVFFKAVRKGMLRAVRACIDKGLDPVIARNEGGQSALHIAAAAGNVAMVAELLSVRVPVNVQDRDGRSALHYAVERGHEDVIRLLLENFASTILQDKLGKRAFDGAVLHRPV